MTCASCVAAIEKHVKKMGAYIWIWLNKNVLIELPLDGVGSIMVALMSAKAEVLFDPVVVQPKHIAHSIGLLGKKGTLAVLLGNGREFCEFG